jgi:hypothetical protein
MAMLLSKDIKAKDYPLYPLFSSEHSACHILPLHLSSLPANQ